MNYSIVFYIIGWILNLEAAFMSLGCITALIYGEKAGWSFVVSILLCLVIGLPLTVRKPSSHIFYLRESFVSTALGWIALSCMGSLPFLFSGVLHNPADALFETVSGFTTTGSSIFSDVEVLPRCILFWRSFTHWIGGMGVLVFLLILPPLAVGGRMNLMKAESPGPSVSRLVPKVQATAKILYILYVIMTLVEIVLLLAGGMPLFDSLTITFGTAGTGGFGIKNDSCAGYTTYQQVVITVFMILFGVNFNFYFLLAVKKGRQTLQSEEVRAYLLIILAAVLLIAVNIRGYFSHFWQAVQQSAFQVGSIITTTGYATTDFNLWPEFSRTILVMLMFVGACARSTGGGIKVYRLLIMVKTVKKELRQLLHPRSIKKIQIDGKAVEHEVVRSTNVFLIVYLLIFIFSILLVSLDNKDLITNFTAVAATLNNIGPGLGDVGPLGNFSGFSNFSKLVMTFDMLAGRLELFPLLLLFMRSTWKKF